MSAIFGVYNLDGKPVSSKLLEEMSAILSHRGADDTGIWSDGFVGFGHRMLWTTPESLDEKLPKSFHNGDFAITADARIDNRDELLNQLGLPPHPAEKTLSDSEIILFSYEKWGEECTEKLLGDFAFAIWDKRNRRVFCARDHFGVKSLYYYHSENLFVFATEIKALLLVPEVPRVLNELKVGDYLTLFFDDVPNTFYKNIYRLPSNHQMTVDRDGKRLKTYWSLDPERELILPSDEQYAENFRELFTEAVHCRLRSAYPVGSMLSGGLDSSSIACTARELMMKSSAQAEKGESKLHTFSAVFEDVAESDESFYIDAVLKKGNFEPHFLVADHYSPMTDMEKINWHQDEALSGSNIYINYHLYQIAQSRGVRVLLDGYDGDTTVSHGVRYLLELAQSKRWFSFTREARGYAKNFDESASALIWSYYWRYDLEPKLSGRRALNPLQRVGQKIYGYATGKSKYASPQFSDLAAELNPDFIEKINLAEHQRVLTNSRFRHPKNEREDHYVKLLSNIIQWTLEVQGKTAAPFAVEVRYPFWDKRLVEFCLSLPARQKMRHGLTRMIMRRAMDGILPKEVQWRPDKGNLSHGFKNGLEKFENRRLCDLIKTNRRLLEKYINIDLITEKVEGFSNGTASIIDLKKITTFVSLALWLRSADFDE